MGYNFELEFYKLRESCKYNRRNVKKLKKSVNEMKKVQVLQGEFQNKLKFSIKALSWVVGMVGFKVAAVIVMTVINGGFLNGGG